MRPMGATTILSHEVAVKLQNLKNLRPARAVNPHAAGVSNGDTTTLSPERAVQLKNPQARQGLSNFGPFGPVNPHAHQGVSKGDITILGPKGRRPLLHNPPPQAAITSSPAGAGHLPL